MAYRSNNNAQALLKFNKIKKKKQKNKNKFKIIVCTMKLNKIVAEITLCNQIKKKKN